MLKPNLREIAEKKAVILTNAASIRRHGAAARALIAEAGLDLKVAVISGDDLLDARDNFADKKDMFSGAIACRKRWPASMRIWAGFPLRSIRCRG